MKVPDLSDLEISGVHAWSGDTQPLAAAAAAAKLRFVSADLRTVDSKVQLLGAVAMGLKLPEHFGNNWDALADSVEDGEWLGKHGCVIALDACGRLSQGARHGLDHVRGHPRRGVRLLARAAQALLGFRELSAARLPFKIPVSALIVVYTQDLRVLLIERADYPGHWQSVTGSQEKGETLRETAIAGTRGGNRHRRRRATAASTTGGRRATSRSSRSGRTAIRRARHTTPSTGSGWSFPRRCRSGSRRASICGTRGSRGRRRRSDASPGPTATRSWSSRDASLEHKRTS